MEILQTCAYGAEHAGNFIASLLYLEQQMQNIGYRTIYAFPEKARDKEWCKEIQNRTDVYFLPEAKARILPKTYSIFREIYKKHNISIMHSHFELYDIPATVTAPRDTKIFWHLHDPLDIRGSRYPIWKFQYGVVGKRATLLSVSEYYKNIAVGIGFPREKTRVILNSIALDRIKKVNNNSPRYDFSTFGWDFYRKGDDLILKACDRLWNEGYRFEFLLNGNEKTWGLLNEYLEGAEYPRYLETGDPVSDINAIFNDTRVFIQASRKETFSYAVCEAAYAGIPVISSDIPGLEWAHELPTVTFFQNDDWEELYKKMKEYLDATQDAHDFELTRQIIEDRYSLKVWAGQVMLEYGIKSKNENFSN